MIKSINIIFPLILATSPALAEDSAPTIDGGIQMNIQASGLIAAGIGNESSATQEAGTIDSGSVTGDIETTLVLDGDISAAIGNKACSDQKIGTIGSKDAC